MSSAAPLRNFISAKDLAHVAGPDQSLVILDIRFRLGMTSNPRQDYADGHIPGAIYAHLPTDLAGSPTPSGGAGPLPTAAAFEATLRRWGITPASHIVVYDDNNGLQAARAWWLLRWAGLERVQVLDGGLAAWRRAGLALTADVPAPQPSRIAIDVGHMPQLQTGAVAGFPGRGVLLDARDAAKYSAGHIPGALSLPASQNLDAEGYLLDKTLLRQRFAQLGLDAARSVAAYCGGGVTAAHDVLVLAELDIPAALYIGSWSAWTADGTRPVATGIAPGEAVGDDDGARQLHLGFIFTGIGQHPGAWRISATHPRDTQHMPYIQNLARKAEAAKFDFFFRGDILATSADMQYVSPNQAVRLEPFTMMASVAAVTERIGVVVTANTTYADPFHLARQTASLDVLSEGRAAWNVVTGDDVRAAANFGKSEHGDPETRYDRAEEFVEVVRGLWDSWDDDAVIADAPLGQLIDANKVHTLHHAGRHFNVAGPLNVPRPLQGQVPLLMAGTSEQSRALAAKQADVVFAAAPTLAEGQALYHDLKSRLPAHGRSAADMLILPGLVPYVGRTRQDAFDLCRRLGQCIPVAPDLAALGRETGVSLDGLDADALFPAFDEADPACLLARIFVEQAREINAVARPTIRQVFEYRVARGKGHLVVIGSAVDVADQIEYWFRHDAADGFMVSPPHLPDGLDDFIALVLPILRERGLFRTEYSGHTLRDHFGLPVPGSRFAQVPA